MAAKDVLGESAEAKRPIGSGTKVSGYVDTPVEKRCGTCEYLVDKNLCENKRVLKDKEVKTDKASGLKKVDPENGCCSFWEAGEESEDED